MDGFIEIVLDGNLNLYGYPPLAFYQGADYG
jgi:hypothetical protein